MLRIAICDDEKLFRENIKKYVLKYLSEKDISSEIDMFNSGKELLGLGTDLLGYNIIFLDINMDEIDGIMTAHKIREYSMDIYIVFETAYVNYSLEGYKVDATRYLLKNTINFDESIYECMDTILHKMNYIVLKKYFKFNECEKNVQVDRILYIESRLHKLEFHIMEDAKRAVRDIMEDKVLIYTLYATLNDMEREMMEYKFIRIHQSFLVNLKHIKSITGYSVILNNNQKLVVPRARYKDVKSAFIAYKGEV